MIELMFEFGDETILVRVEGTRVLFGSTLYGAKLADISGLKLSYAGVCREFPDLETDYCWKQKAIFRFKEKIKSIGDEERICEYIISELKKHHYIPKYKMKQGFRRIKL